VIVACSLDNGIGVGSRLPWKLPRDLAYFERVTRGVRASVYPPGCRNAIIMGRLTYMSIPARARPLANRLNVVLTNDAAFIARQDILTAPTLDDALAQLATRTDVADVYIGGGTRVYAEAVEHPHCEQVFLTRVHQTIPECTAHFPALFGAELDVITKAGWRRASHAELKAWL
ncbi:dihydrofolate reductase, partial [Thamnocephalis sphaerospora]